MSGFPGEVIGKHGVLVSGAFVQKPFTSSGLVEKVREVFGEYPAPATGFR